MTEYEKMIKGMVYDYTDLELTKLRDEADTLCLKYNQTNNLEERTIILEQLLGKKCDCFVRGPIYFDYGKNTIIGKNSYINFNFCCLDVCPVTIGENVLIGPNVSIYTALHPLLVEERKPYINDLGIVTDKEYGKPVTIHDNVWLGGSVTILPGVTIGKNSVIGAGSVVTKDIPEGVLAFGNPCKVIRKIDQNDSILLKKELW